MSSSLRGSEKLLQRHCHRRALEDADLSRLIESIDIDGVQLDRVFCYGQPNPDIIAGSLTVDKQVFGKVSDHLLGLKELRVKDLEIFPYGIPIIDRIRVDFQIGRGY